MRPCGQIITITICILIGVNIKTIKCNNVRSCDSNDEFVNLVSTSNNVRSCVSNDELPV